MEILSDSVFHGKTRFKNDVRFDNSEFHWSDTTFYDTANVAFNGGVIFRGDVDFFGRTTPYFDKGILTSKLFRGSKDSEFTLPYCNGGKGSYTLATTQDLCSKVSYIVVDVPEVSAACTLFKLTNSGHGGDIPLSIQMFKKDNVCGDSYLWTPVQVDFYNDWSYGLCEIIVKKSSSFGIEAGSYQIRATYYHP